MPQSHGVLTPRKDRRRTRTVEPALAPPTIGGSPVLLLLELDDVDATADRARQAGATVEMPVQEMFWGERYGVLRDPFGHRWALSTARQQLTPDDIADRTPGDAAS